MKILVNIAIDADSKCRELASQLIGEANYFNHVSVRRGFEILISRLDDLNKDVPDATTMVSCFIARAIVDEAIPPSFVQEVAFQQDLGTSPLTIQCLQKVQHLLNMKLSGKRLAKVWGPGRGRPVAELKETISLMLDSFFRVNDLNELANSLKEMSEPNFHHEFVKQTVIKSAEKGQKSVDDAASMILLFVEKELVDAYEVKIGVQRVTNGLDNYAIDIPTLPKALEQMKEKLEVVLTRES